MLRVELLNAIRDRSGFDCGVETLNRYLQQIARQHIAKGISKTFVLLDEDAGALSGARPAEPTPFSPLTLFMPAETIRKWAT